VTRHKKVLSLAALLIVLALTGLGAPAQAQPSTPAPRPIVDLNSQCLLGASQGGKWLDAEVAHKHLKGGEKYRLYNLTRYLSTVTGAKPESIGVPCEDTYNVEMPAGPKRPASVIAVGGTWNALPRVPRSESTNQQVYRSAVASILVKSGIARPRVNITQVLRVDLEGDRTDEVIVTATNRPRGLYPAAEAGEYSMVSLRKLVKGKVETFMLEGDFQPEAVEFGAPLTHKVTAVLDLNGDGIMEIVVDSQYYEGHWSTVYQVVTTANGVKLVPALSCGCGL